MAVAEVEQPPGGSPHPQPIAPGEKDFPSASPIGPKLQPGIPNGVAGALPPQDYIQLARSISNQHAPDLAKPANLQAGPPVEDLLTVIKRFSNSKDPVVRAAAAKLEAGRQRAVQAVADVQSGADAAAANLESVLGAAGRGDYTQKVERTYQSVDTSGKIRTITTTETVDNSGLPVFGAAMLNAWVQSNAPAKMKYRAAVAMEMARLETWNELELKLADLYPASPADPKIVQFRITSPDVQTGRMPSFAAINGGSRALTNVTLVLDLVHFMTAPGGTTFQVYFIPRWEAGQAIYLPTSCVRNRRRDENDRGRPSIANPAQNSPDADRARKNPWLAGVGGVVEVRSTLWAVEAHQPAGRFPFPAQAEAGGLWEMTFANQNASVYVSNWNNRKHPPDERFKLAEGWETRTARRVVQFAPADSEAARQARLLLDDPQAMLLDLHKRRVANVTKLTRPGTVYSGEWIFEVMGLGNVIFPLPDNVRRAVVAQRDRHGKIALRIDSRSGSDVTATLYDPDQPMTTRKLTGKIRNGGLLNPIMAFSGAGETPRTSKQDLESMSKEERAKARAKALADIPRFTPEHLLPVSSPWAVTLSPRGTGLFGISPGYPTRQPYRLVLDLPLSAASAPVDDGWEPPMPPPDPVKVFLAMIEPGATFTGDWRLHVGNSSSPLVTSDIRQALNARKDKGGKIILRINSCNQETHAVTATLSDAAQPQLQKQLKGIYVRDKKTGQASLRLAGAAAGRRPLRNVDKLNEFLNFFTAPGTITFEPEGNALSGKFIGPIDGSFWYVLTLEPGPAIVAPLKQ